MSDFKKQLEPLGMMAPDACNIPPTTHHENQLADLLGHMPSPDDDAPC